VTVREDDAQKELIQSILDHSDRRQEKMSATIKALQDSIAVLNRELDKLRKAATEQPQE
jgi:hypothetical protein